MCNKIYYDSIVLGFGICGDPNRRPFPRWIKVKQLPRNSDPTENDTEHQVTILATEERLLADVTIVCLRLMS